MREEIRNNPNLWNYLPWLDVTIGDLFLSRNSDDCGDLIVIIGALTKRVYELERKIGIVQESRGEA